MICDGEVAIFSDNKNIPNIANKIPGTVVWL